MLRWLYATDPTGSATGKLLFCIVLISVLLFAGCKSAQVKEYEDARTEAASADTAAEDALTQALRLAQEQAETVLAQPAESEAGRAVREDHAGLIEGLLSRGRYIAVTASEGVRDRLSAYRAALDGQADADKRLAKVVGTQLPDGVADKERANNAERELKSLRKSTSVLSRVIGYLYWGIGGLLAFGTALVTAFYGLKFKLYKSTTALIYAILSFVIGGIACVIWYLYGSTLLAAGMLVVVLGAGALGVRWFLTTKHYNSVIAAVQSVREVAQDGGWSTTLNTSLSSALPESTKTDITVRKKGLGL